jgi:hypothetical protein
MVLLRYFIACMLLSMAMALPAAADVPKTLMGISLGEDIQKYQDLIRSGSDVQAEDYPYLTEAVLTPGKLPGVRVGYIAYGRCANVGKIVRIKLKLRQPGREYYNRLLELYKKKLGKPQQYRGDPFQNLVAWKWSLKDGGSRISLILSNSRDPEESPGNQIKITMQNLMKAERECWRKEHPRKSHGQNLGKTGPVDINDLVPK